MKKHELLQNLAENIERERLRLDITQAEFARRLGVSLSTYKNIVSRRIDKIDLTLAPAIYNVTGKFLFELMGEEDEEIRLIRKYRLLNRRQQEYVLLSLDLLIDRSSAEISKEYIVDVLGLLRDMIREYKI